MKGRAPKKENRHAWLGAPSVSWRLGLVVAAIWATGMALLARSSFGEYLDFRLARRVDFNVREMLGKSPAVTEHLKILSIDDKTFARLGTWVLSLDQWVSLLKGIDASKPRGIFIDAMFSQTDETRGDVQKAIAELGKIKAPVTVGSFVTPEPIRYREALDLGSAQFSYASLLGGRPEEEAPPLLDRRAWFAYGPHPALRQVFQIGNFSYPDNGHSAIAMRIGQDAVLGHLAFYLASERKFEGGRLVLDGRPVPLTPQGDVYVNFPSPKMLKKHNRSLVYQLENALNGKPVEGINEGDIVLILPQMFTGNTDFKHTPFGAIPGGYVIATMLNSVATGQWLRPLAYTEVIIGAAAALGVAVAIHAGIVTFWLWLAGGLLVGFTSILYAFSFHGVVMPWLFMLTGYAGAALTLFAEKTRVGEKKSQMLRNALEGSVAPDDLKTILKRPESINFEARERVVTLMFIDVVGFSLLAENMLPRMAFDNLKRMLATIAETIHAHGGIIDKTLGDGLLCYFGYRFDVDSSSPDHAEKALRCAIKIQMENIAKNIEAAERGEPVYPLRIGINTSSCYLGDLGAGDRIDFTVVGNGVNFAKRLEGACEMHSVLIGATTYDLVKSIGLAAAAFSKRFIRIKHHSELVEAHEFDPIHENPELRLAAVEGFRRCANIERVDQRWPVHDATKIQVTCDFGDTTLVNFSHNGLGLKMKQPLAKGTRLNVTLDSAGGVLKGLLIKDGIDLLQGEVRWGYAEAGEHVHGVLITNLDERQSDALVQYLCEFAFTRDSRRPTPEAS
jgi:class 3 adenylate cyclase